MNVVLERKKNTNLSLTLTTVLCTVYITSEMYDNEIQKVLELMRNLIITSTYFQALISHFPE